MSERKTIQVNDLILHKELKKMSAETGMTVGELAENGIRMILLEMKGVDALSPAREMDKAGELTLLKVKAR